jgi:hypothetical protein
MPTRFTKQLAQLLRGVALGIDRARALRLAIRCARDSMPPLRLAILKDVVGNPGTRTRDVRERLDKPYNTVDRELQALHMLGALECEEFEDEDSHKQGGATACLSLSPTSFQICHYTVSSESKGWVTTS